MALNLLPVVLCESRDDANIENVMGEEDGQDVRKSMFSNKRYVANMHILLPWLDKRGLFDLRIYILEIANRTF